MERAEEWFACRIAFVETSSKSISASSKRAGELTLTRGPRSLDASHLASALLLPPERLTLTTWDDRLHSAALAEGIVVAPEALG